MKINEQIKAARLTAGLSQSGLADLTGIDRVNIIALEKGRRNPGVQTLSKLAQALGCIFEVK